MMKSFCLPSIYTNIKSKVQESLGFCFCAIKGMNLKYITDEKTDEQNGCKQFGLSYTDLRSCVEGGGGELIPLLLFNGDSAPSTNFILP